MQHSDAASDPDEEQREAAAALSGLVARLAAAHLDEVDEPEHFGALMRSLARAGQGR